jgi:hypothetical protein
MYAELRDEGMSHGKAVKVLARRIGVDRGTARTQPGSGREELNGVVEQRREDDQCHKPVDHSRYIYTPPLFGSPVKKKTFYR